MNEVKHAIEEGLSAELLTVLGAKFDLMPTIPMPATVDEAIIASGQAAANFNNGVLVPLVGLPLVELILKSGQLNDVYRGLLLSALEINEDYAGFEIREPLVSEQYAQGVHSLSVQAAVGVITGVSCTVIAPDDTVDTITAFTASAGIWTADITYTMIGTYALSFDVSFEPEGQVSKDVTAWII